MWGCRTRRRSRSSLHKEATVRKRFFELAVRGAFTATGVPRRRPTATKPKPPRPNRTLGVKISTSLLGTSQCSRTPMSTMDRRNFSISAPGASSLLRARRCTSPKTRAVVTESATLTVSDSHQDLGGMLPLAAPPPGPASRPPERDTGSAATAASSGRLHMVEANGGSCFSSCSTWLTPMRKKDSAPPAQTTATCVRIVAKATSKAAGIDCTSNVSFAEFSSAENLPRSASARNISKPLPCIGVPKKASCLCSEFTTRPQRSRRRTRSQESHDICSRPRATSSRSWLSCWARHFCRAKASCRRPQTKAKKHRAEKPKLNRKVPDGIVVPLTVAMSGYMAAPTRGTKNLRPEQIGMNTCKENTQTSKANMPINSPVRTLSASTSRQTSSGSAPQELAAWWIVPVELIPTVTNKVRIKATCSKFKHLKRPNLRKLQATTTSKRARRVASAVPKYTSRGPHATQEKGSSSRPRSFAYTGK
mmetsp:Transcript_25795/g.74484  ORF Transcript_25795/g.74484 Transcript_25795/m.74484 type:complete len:477 (-) Transcript_25795:205-1635(-)